MFELVLQMVGKDENKNGFDDIINSGWENCKLQRTYVWYADIKPMKNIVRASN